MSTWTEICADPALEDVPYKIESNRWGEIIMSPAFFHHANSQSRLERLLEKHAPPGRVMPECPVQTCDGVRVPDVVWLSRALYRAHREVDVLPVAPEICVEILSKSNSREQMLAKAQLYFAAKAHEVWLCWPDGTMEFYLAAQPNEATTSHICPAFPRKVILDDADEDDSAV